MAAGINMGARMFHTDNHSGCAGARAILPCGILMAAMEDITVPWPVRRVDRHRVGAGLFQVEDTQRMPRIVDGHTKRWL